MTLPTALRRVGRLLALSLNAVILLVISAIICAALVYSFETTPIFLWLSFAVFAVVGYISVGFVGAALLENGPQAALKILLYVLLIWATIFVYVDMMRYLAVAWGIKIGETTMSILEFPRYFVLHTNNFFRDLGSVVTGSPNVAPIEIIPEPQPVVPKTTTPWLAINSFVRDTGWAVALGLFTNWLFAIWWDSNRRR